MEEEEAEFAAAPNQVKLDAPIIEELPSENHEKAIVLFKPTNFCAPAIMIRDNQLRKMTRRCKTSRIDVKLLFHGFLSGRRLRDLEMARRAAVVGVAADNVDSIGKSPPRGEEMRVWWVGANERMEG